MPARDTDHDSVKRALTDEVWTVTHDPYTIEAGGEGKVYFDLGAERTIAAERDGVRIAVEIKSFRGRSNIRDLEQAVGQYFLYLTHLRRIDPGRILYLAVPEDVYENTFHSAIIRPLLEDIKSPLIVFNPEVDRIVRWIR